MVIIFSRMNYPFLLGGSLPAHPPRLESGNPTLSRAQRAQASFGARPSRLPIAPRLHRESRPGSLQGAPWGCVCRSSSQMPVVFFSSASAPLRSRKSRPVGRKQAPPRSRGRNCRGRIRHVQAVAAILADSLPAAHLFEQLVPQLHQMPVILGHRPHLDPPFFLTLSEGPPRMDAGGGERAGLASAPSFFTFYAYLFLFATFAHSHDMIHWGALAEDKQQPREKKLIRL